ncbi:NTP transferase domain-containing protein [Halopiger goleimassiliensis]|uniref:NTP transferase domain-containing protein n=1 Tax=Halopiger goleimassiliensis TaxID=1293048 RepID=UPI000677AF50|nr:NTP transferase domain-containing protein [Halopiger goleimassiliensis]
MCGGEGSRLESPHEKPLHPIDGVAMVDRVREALAASRVETIYAAVSPNAPETRAHLEQDDAPTVTTVETAGEGYVADLGAVLERPAVEPPVLTVAADLPLLEATVVDRILAFHGERDASRTVCVPVALKRRLGVGVDATLEGAPHLAPTGINVVGSSDETMTAIHYDPRLAVNVNRRTDARVAASHLQRRRSEGDPCA